MIAVFYFSRLMEAINRPKLLQTFTDELMIFSFVMLTVGVGFGVCVLVVALDQKIKALRRKRHASNTTQDS